ncbi:MAG: hypothetical protein M2R45_04599 [Verrucomicrobia subdivision 3 bacterium]|nr:hypothetical protein [Limisphaerales bacterium]MCS1417338.1 hypothetical protein [Limisphaerales bacterium]
MLELQGFQAVSGGLDLAVVGGSDFLIAPENVADLVREAAAGLSGDEILFNASYNHSGPGALRRERYRRFLMVVYPGNALATRDGIYSGDCRSD